MGVIERKEREKEQRRQQILEAGEKIFTKYGLANASVEQIANECEISRGTLYLYFKSKEELFQTIILKCLDILYNMMKESITDDAPVERKMTLIGEAYLSFYKNYRNYFKLLNYLPEHEKGEFNETGKSVELLEKSEKIWGIVTEIISDGIKKGYFKKNINPKEISILLWSSSNGVIQVMDHFKFSHLGEVPFPLKEDTRHKTQDRRHETVDRSLKSEVRREKYQVSSIKTEGTRQETEDVIQNSEFRIQNSVEFDICDFTQLNLERMLSQLWGAILSTIRVK